MQSKIEVIKNNKKVFAKNIVLCPRCYLPQKKRKLIKCSGTCKCKYCYHCLTEVGNKYYCPDCLSNFIKQDVSLIVTRGFKK